MKKMDEMDRNIRMRSESWGYRAAMLFLWIWLMYSLYKSKVYGAKIEIFPWMILSISSFVQLVSETVMKLKMVAGDEEYKEDRKSRILFEVIVGAALLIFLIIYGGAFLLTTAV